MSSSSTTLPGRLGSPDMTLRHDPRADPRMIAAMEPFGLADAEAEAPVDAASSIEDLRDYCRQAEEGFELLFAALVAGLPEVDGVTRSVETIRGVDGNDVTLYLHRPVEDGTDRVGVLHLHGGGMVLLEAAGAAYAGLRDELAARGMVVVGVEFRNGGGKHGDHPFPAGLHDCTSAVRWMNENRERLGIRAVVISGESGGGNLTLATALEATRDGDQVDGVYAMCPYISGAYAAAPEELTSLRENDGYFLSCRTMGGLARIYDPDGEHASDPLAWPLHASIEDLRRLPPHVISVNELDPLRDEGLAYHRKLTEAGVESRSRVVAGTCHAGDLIFRDAMPDVFDATVDDIAAFANSR